MEKIRKDGKSAADLFTFVDVERHVNYELHTNDRCLGWVLVHLLPECGACVLVSPEKWIQLKDCWRKWFDMIDSGEEQRDHKELLSGRDFLGNNSDVSIVV
eukprot:scaffold37772_cov133-Skeletonema_marinoi.AAC.1